MVACDPRGPLMIHCVKMYSSFDGKSFSTFGRIYSGTVRPGKSKSSLYSVMNLFLSFASVLWCRDLMTCVALLHCVGDRVRVLGEAYSPDDDEDMAMATVEAVSIPRGRSRTDVTMAKAGNWVLLDGVDANISKTATITSAAGDENNPVEEDDIEIFAPLKFPQVCTSIQ
jgi:U5 small nuclear ribonucleoprotein component